MTSHCSNKSRELSKENRGIFKSSVNFAGTKLILNFFRQMEQYSKALKILVYKLEDYAGAERFCELHSKVNKNARLSTNM